MLKLTSDFQLCFLHTHVAADLLFLVELEFYETSFLWTFEQGSSLGYLQHVGHVSEDAMRKLLSSNLGFIGQLFKKQCLGSGILHCTSGIYCHF